MRWAVRLALEAILQAEVDAFISDRDGAWGIYLMQPDGSQQRKLLDLGPVYPDWLNQRLAWAP